MYYQNLGLQTFVLCLLLMVGKANAQTWDTTFVLKEVEILDHRLSDFSNGVKIDSISNDHIELFSSQTLSDILGDKASVSLKTYGISSLSTTSFRGSSAAHTAILWNGINLQSSMNGQHDLALNPVFFIDDLRLQSGGAGALFGSGAIGGVIHMNSKPDYLSGLSINFNSSYSSFSTFFEGLSLAFGSKRSFSKIRALYTIAKNDFTFQNTAKFGAPFEKLSNAELIQRSVLFDQYFRINDKQQIDFHIWLQDLDRQLPPTMTMSESVAFQQDNNIRIVSNWKRYGTKNRQIVKLAYLNENIRFVDSFVSIDANNNSQSIIGEFENSYKINKQHLLNVGINNSFKSAKVSDYVVNPTQINNSLFVSYKFSSKNNKLFLSANLREELVDMKTSPITPSIGFNYLTKKHFSFSGYVSKVYRNPTFNDLYWNPGGNKDLIAEDGWSSDLGFAWDKKTIKSNYKIGANLYSNQINNLIIWLPESASLWKPQNIRKVWSRGLELDAEMTSKLGQFDFMLKPSYSFVKSTNSFVSDQNAGILDKQLIYCPLHQFRTSVVVKNKQYAMTINYSLTGKQFTKSDNSSSLPAYQLINLSIGRKSTANLRFNYHVIFKVNNLLNTSYQAIEWRPMPGRYYSVTLKILFKNINKI